MKEDRKYPGHPETTQTTPSQGDGMTLKGQGVFLGPPIGREVEERGDGGRSLPDLIWFEGGKRPGNTKAVCI